MSAGNDSWNSSSRATLSSLQRGDSLPMATVLVFSFLALLGALITAANTLVFMLVWRRPFLRVKTNYLLVSLAVSDCMSGTLCIPLLISCTAITPYSQTVCVAMDVCQRFLAISTILHLTTAVLERYFKIADSFRHIAVVTKSRVVLAVIVIWALSLFTALVQTAWINHPDSVKIYLIYDIVVLIVLVCVPFASIAAAYTSLFLIIKRGKSRRKKLSGSRAAIPRAPILRAPRADKNKRNERRAMTVYMAMTIAFAVGWFPYFVLTILDDLEFRIEVPFWLSVLLLFLKYGTSLVDPLLFTFFKADFQKALMSILRRNNDDYSTPSSSNPHDQRMITETSSLPTKATRKYPATSIRSNEPSFTSAV